MSAPEDTPSQPALDRVLGGWMDGNTQAEGPTMPSGTESRASEEAAGLLSDRERFGAAQLQLVHALLLHLNDNEDVGRQARISRAMKAIRNVPTGSAVQETQTVEPVRIIRRRFGSLLRWAMAASLLIAAVSWLYLSGSNPALAALDRVVRAMDDPVDRTYEISVEPIDQPALPEHDRRPSEREANVVPPEDRRPGLDGAILYVRGRNQFVLFRSTPNDKLVINGSNGRENWLIRPDRPVLVSQSLGAFRIPMPENLATVPFVAIGDTLTGLRYAYQVRELAAERLTEDDPTRWRHLEAQKIDPATKGPKVVSVWFHPTSNMIGRIEFEQMHLQGRPESRRMTISLVAHQPLPANWFDHATHHSPDTPIELVAP